MKNITAQEILNGDILTRKWVTNQKWVALLVFALLVLYVYSAYAAQRQQRKIDDLKKELVDEQYTLSTKRAELTKLTRQSSLSEELNKRGSQLRENQEPIIRIR
ncbi:MAG: hypothetical protein J6T32_02830 [Paludibacteraceae bacterium]|nr:hypothetical protein [Paludibacteraceae bacterium]